MLAVAGLDRAGRGTGGSMISCTRGTRSLRRLGALLVGAMLAACVPQPALRADGWPAVPGAVFAFRSADITQPVVAFDMKGRQLLAFNAEARGRGLVGRTHDLVCDGGWFHARGAGPWIGRSVTDSGAFTIELTLTPAITPSVDEAVVLAFGDDEGESVALLHRRDSLMLRVRGNCIPLFSIEAGVPSHGIVACGDSRWMAYKDGRAMAMGPLPDGAASWGERQLVLGATWSGKEKWRGRIEGIALFPRVLSPQEAAAEAAALKRDIPPAPQVTFRGTLVRQAPTTDVVEMRPYTRSLTAAEYRVDEVLAGEWTEPTITVLHWMVMDGQRLPLADRPPGAAVTLTVERLEDHPQLESSRRDEITDAGLATDIFYCESEAAIAP